ncbi:hypothetical protein [Pseudoduganella lutea]|uniref:SMODS and SLOG-associating 2TM effector domain-containing protein n=1 Tax=Pseudoduganella lutea TaxID=321985 RepID=A0A4P6L4K7_9BURK|nr:hypothetical protein [Pseudoduganella lutea]QBE65818.1 hypothetical protein EWM63_24915 [Pseudoduganella lutea]
MPEPISLLEKEISELNDRLLALEKKGKFRRITAYFFKLVAGGSSLAIASNFFPDANQALGAAALVCVFLDGVFANHARLIGEIQAGHAARAQRDKIARDYNRNLAPILDKMRKTYTGTPEREEAESEKSKLQVETHIKLHDSVMEVEKALADLDLKALNFLSLEAERSTKHP